MIELMIMCAVIMIIAAIAIPNIMISKYKSNYNELADKLKSGKRLTSEENTQLNKIFEECKDFEDVKKDCFNKTKLKKVDGCWELDEVTDKKLTPEAVPDDVKTETQKQNVKLIMMTDNEINTWFDNNPKCKTQVKITVGENVTVIVGSSYLYIVKEEKE
jgi:Tfp pilus assembly protein PilE